MAKSGAPSSATVRGGARSVGTRRLLIDAAVDVLESEGYAGASARAIADRAGSNQGLIFYHFGSVANLLLAALDSVSTARMEQYGNSVASVGSATELADTAAAIFRSDLDAGYITVLVEMIAGSSSTPGLAAEVAARIGPWKEFAQAAIENSLGDSPLGQVLPSKDVAYAIVALYLGLEMLSHLDGDRKPALALFAHAKRLAGLFEAMIGSLTDEESATDEES